MSKVINEFYIDKYVVLILDNMPNESYHKFRIKGEEFAPVTVYDGNNCIAIESKESFIGEIIEFLS